MLERPDSPFRKQCKNGSFTGVQVIFFNYKNIYPLRKEQNERGKKGPLTWARVKAARGACSWFLRVSAEIPQELSVISSHFLMMKVMGNRVANLWRNPLNYSDSRNAGSLRAVGLCSRCIAPASPRMGSSPPGGPQTFPSSLWTLGLSWQPRKPDLPADAADPSDNTWPSGSTGGRQRAAGSGGADCWWNQPAPWHSCDKGSRWHSRWFCSTGSGPDSRNWSCQ